MNKRIFFCLLVFALFTGCSTPENTRSGKLKIVTTTGMLYDAVLNIAQDRVEVEALMGPGVDPHLYKATQGDLSKLNQANMIIYNGLLLEGKMGEIFQKLSRYKAVYAAAEHLPKHKLKASVQYENAFDPHVWFDVSLWKLVVAGISQTLQREDSINASFYAQNSALYLASLDSLHSFAKNRIAEIPDTRRILVTAHDAFGYFGEAYNIRVEGLQGISTVSDFGLRDVSEITDLIVENEVRAIFIETSVSDKAIKAVVRGCQGKGHDVRIGGSLYSDAMGPFGTVEGTYIGMVRSNVETIVEALK